MAFSFLLAAVAAVAVAAFLQDRYPDHLAMCAVTNHREPSHPRLRGGRSMVLEMHDDLRSVGAGYDPVNAPRPWWNRVGFGNRPPNKVVVGKRAWVQWWERVRALILLAAVITALGVLLAATVGLVVFLLGFLLEQAVS